MAILRLRGSVHPTRHCPASVAARRTDQMGPVHGGSTAPEHPSSGG